MPSFSSEASMRLTTDALTPKMRRSALCSMPFHIAPAPSDISA
jgi:hypothetical protein